MREVKYCFGRCGDTDLETHPDPRSNEKPRLHCTIMCLDFTTCRLCYYSWWKHRRPREKETREFIRKFMKSAHLRFKK